jgi:argininosuccinate synthase
MGRDEELAYAKKHNIPVKQTAAKPYSYDDNMWGVTGEGGEIENPALIPPVEKILQITTPPAEAPNQEEIVEVEFVKGLPVAVNGEPMKLTDIILKLNKIGSKHGVGIVHLIEDRVVGLKVRGLYEAPGARIIITAHKDLEKYVSTRQENEFKATVDTKWAYLCYGALWYEPLFEDLNAFIDRINQKVTGKVKLKLFKGNCEAVAVETPNTIFQEKLATFMSASSFNQNASAGFIELYTLQMRMAQRSEKTALLSIGKRGNKVKALPVIRKLSELQYKLYATYKTHKFLKQHGIEAILVNKISQPQLKPNLADLLAINRFDFILNLPSGSKAKEKTDGQMIREYAVKFGATLVTELSVARDLVEKIYSTQLHKTS